jgi:hypothetical protein
MLVSEDDTAVMYVDGMAVRAVSGAYNLRDTSDLTIGTTTGGNQSFFLGGRSEFFDGVMDDVQLMVIGSNSSEDYGMLDFFAENAYARDVAFAGIDTADVNLDGRVAGNGTGPAATDDVTAFVEGFFTQKELDLFNTEEFDPIIVGDIETRRRGDLNVDGIVDLGDWAILNAAAPASASLALNAIRVSQVPEPSGAVLGGFALLNVLVFSLRRRRGCS